MCEFKEVCFRTFFTCLLNNVSIENLVTLGNLLSTKIMKPWQQLCATLGRSAWVPQELRIKVLNRLIKYHRMIGPAPKPWDVYDNKKQWRIGNWMENQNPILYIEL
jgi:hypothetical protein